jgi:hypothetical protein
MNGELWSIDHVPGYCTVYQGYLCSPGPNQYAITTFDSNEGLFFDGDITNVQSPAAFPLTVADGRALTILSKKLVNHRQAINGSTFVAELSEAIRMIRSPAKSLRHGINAYFKSAKKRTRRANIPTANRILSDTWLEYSFGWAPLINDINGARSVFDKLRKQRKVTVLRAPGVYESSELTNGNFNSGRTLFRWVKDEQVFVLVYYQAWMETHLDPLSQLVRVTGFDWPSFLPTVWEVIPYSFLVDYFTNVGDIISALVAPKDDVQFVSKTSVRSRAHLLVSRGEAIGAGVYNYPWSLNVPSVTKVSRRIVDRAPYTGSLIPSLVWEIPGQGSLKWLNIAALANMRRLR